ncbi:putative inactive heme oxygenase 2, chloroplastic [Curcuma longa]|uniref:putative inactive heme oxygenase 2, chloroplastic n=1 Tax=Curcuma longa TaxID=136217 RepID=UPI003D9F7D44
MSASSFPSSTSSPSRAWRSLCSPNLLPLNPKLHRFKIPSSSSPPPAFTVTGLPSSTAPVLKKRKRYRRLFPGETEGIVQEMRFVAMRLRDDAGGKEKQEEESSDGGEETWQPTKEGFLKYLVDSKLVFETIERIVDESTDVAKVYFRKTGLERASNLSKDLEWLSKREIIPQPSNPGTTYAKYLSQLAENNVPSFLCHFYNIYFAHITGGQEIGKKVSSMLLEGSELEFYKWDSDANKSLKDVRDNLNKLGEHWTREEKNTCLKEAAKSFRYLGQIVRLIIL